MQVLYALIAMLFLALLSLTLQRAMHAKERRQAVNEVATQLVGVGVDVIEYIGSKPFDEKTDTDEVPAVTDAAQLTPKSMFGEPSDSFAACDDIDDFDEITTSRMVEGLEYNVTIRVNYVEEDDPNSVAPGPTFHKEVKLEITSPHLFISAPAYPLTVEVARVFSYDKATKE